MFLGQFPSPRPHVYCGCADAKWTKARRPTFHRPLCWAPAYLDQCVPLSFFLKICTTHSQLYHYTFRLTPKYIHELNIACKFIRAYLSWIISGSLIALQTFDDCVAVAIISLLWFALSMAPGPSPPQNFSLAHVTATSARVTWDSDSRNLPDGFVVNVTWGLNMRSRYLPSGNVGSYVVHDLVPGQHYQLALTAVYNSDHQQIHSLPLNLAFQTSKFYLCNFHIPRADLL